MTASLNPKKIIKDFPLLRRKFGGKRLVYLDNAATTQKPFQVINALKEFYEKYNANVHRGIYKLSEEATQLYESSREIIAKFIGANSQELIFTKNCTEAINLLAYSLSSKLKKGDEIIISEMEHHSNLVPWQQLALRKGLKLRFVKINDGKISLEDLEKKLNRKTRIVSLSHISNVLGTINPIKKISKMVHEYNALFVVDAAQSVGHVSLNVKSFDVDFLAFSGHKMLGPFGIGCLYGKGELLQKLNPFLYGGDMIKEVKFKKTTFNSLPWKFEAGTPPIVEAIALSKAVGYIKKIGLDEIELHDKKLATYALKRLDEEEVKIYGPKKSKYRASIISFNVGNIHSHDVAAVLDSECIAIRAGHHCCMPLMLTLGVTGTARASFYIYNSKEDVDLLVEGIKKVKKMFI